MCDCLIIGYNDFDFDENVKLIEKSGRNSGAFRDLRLSCIQYQGRYLRPLDALSRFYAEKPGNIRPPFHDMDFMWPTILYLGSYLDRHGLSFDYINLFQFSKARLKEKLLAGGILSIAITTTLYVHPRPVLEIIKFIRKYNQSTRIILGGPYISSQSRGLSSDEFASLLRYLSADYFIINSEGEQALVNLLKALKDGSSPRGIPSLAYFEGDEFVRSAEVSEQNSLEGNEVNYSLFRKEEIGQFLSIRTARSCPFACDYCGFPQRSGKYRYLESELVEKELNRINDLGTVSTLTFLDDTFNVPKERFREILKIMIRNRYDFRWNSYYRSDHGAPDIIELMGKAGCEGVFMGIESGSDEMLKNMRKTARTQHYRQAIPLLREAGVATHANFIVGFPGEASETIRETVDFIETARPDFFLAQLWYCDPVTPVWRRKEEMGISGSGFVWKHATMDYREACDIVDRLFFEIENSVWLPQWGMAQWSTFYLQRHGMSLTQVKDFLRAFNAVVKHQVKSGDNLSIPDELLTALKQTCNPLPPSRLRAWSEISDPDEFVTCLRSRDISLSVDGGDIHLRAPQGTLTPELRQAIVERKSSLVAAFS
jgi:radical SAM PhpK family P-methyltransferase